MGISPPLGMFKNVFLLLFQFWHVLIFLGMACWYRETSFSFAEENNRDCSQLMVLTGLQESESIKQNQTIFEQLFANFLPQYYNLPESSRP